MLGWPIQAQPLQISVDPGSRFQRLEGWGASLCWWANMAGDFPPDQIEKLATLITSPTNLNFNIFRFNIGGGDAPDHHHMRGDGGAMPGYRPGPQQPYDWSADARQRAILLALKGKRSDLILEAFANAPPYWMSKSGCAAGNTDGSNNLRDDCYGEFADYLTEVVKYYKEKHGVVFRTIAPMNEPDADWWKARNKQEGCQFTLDKQVILIRALNQKLSAKGLLGYTQVSAMDANNVDHCLRALTGNQGYTANNLWPLIGQINAHTYFGSQRKELQRAVARYQKRLWQSESGPLHVKSSGLANYLFMAQRIITDLRELQPVAWLDWQIMTKGASPWGLLAGDYEHKTFQVTKAYSVRCQFSRFLRAGSTIIGSQPASTLAALSSAGDQLCVVICQPAESARQAQLDLGKFPSVRGQAVAFRTSETEDCLPLGSLPLTGKTIALTLPPNSITTIVVGLR